MHIIDLLFLFSVKIVNAYYRLTINMKLRLNIKFTYINILSLNYKMI